MVYYPFEKLVYFEHTMELLGSVLNLPYMQYHTEWNVVCEFLFLNQLIEESDYDRFTYFYHIRLRRYDDAERFDDILYKVNRQHRYNAERFDCLLYKVIRQHDGWCRFRECMYDWIHHGGIENWLDVEDAIVDLDFGKSWNSVVQRASNMYTTRAVSRRS